MRLDAMLPGQAAAAVPPVEASWLRYDSRAVRSGEASFAFPGRRVGERHAADALRARWDRVRHGRRALSQASPPLFRRPDRRVALTAVTGTNGKTATARMIASLLRPTDRPTALPGAIQHRVGKVAGLPVSRPPRKPGPGGPPPTCAA